MEDILNNEIARQEYMEMRYKTIDEEQSKPEVDDFFGEKGEKDEKEETEIKYLDEAYNIEKVKIMEELGIFIVNNDKESSK